uniref:Major facilitator superfamily (MFS) profile domain-containing protein n=1 Tax=Panagrolaimus sp. PS1159 TaxID=55785 RepID=A0AC35GJJ4_9BILA
MFNIGEENDIRLKNKKSLKDRLVGKKRWILGIILLFGNFCASSMRTHIGVSMVCMVNATAVHEISEKSDIPQFLPERENSQCRRMQGNETKAIIKGYKGTFVWSTEEQALLFSSGFYGNLLIMFFPGFLINHYGSKKVAFVSAVGMAFTTALMPTLAFLGMYYFMAMRILFGIFEYSIYSALYSIYSALVAPLSLWFSPNERSTAAAIFTSGSPLASSLGVLITTNLCSLDLWNGWPLIFYYTSTVAFIWALAWLAFFTNTPKKSRFLSTEEKSYLHEKNEGHSHPEGDKKKKMPLKKMLTSAAVIAVMCATFNHVITTSLMQNYLPTYARDTLDLDLRSNGIFTSIAFICKIVSKYILSFTADYLKSKKILSPTASCKLFQSTASFGVAFMFCIIAFFIDCTRQHLALIVLCFYGIFAGSAIPGYFTSSCSFAPMYTGMVSSLMEVAGAIGNLLAPALVGFFVKQGQTGEWAYVFMSVAAINIITGTVFLFCGSADIQSWAKPQATSKKNLEESSIELVNDNIGFRRNDSK